jgi:hypothetical protein
MKVDPQQQRVAIGSVDADVRLFRVLTPAAEAVMDSVAADRAMSDVAPADAGEPSSSSHDTLAPCGALMRDATHRVADLAFSDNGAYLAACSTGADPF